MRTRSALFAAVGMLVVSTGIHALQLKPPPTSPRLFVFDCGTLEGDPARFNLKREEMATTNMSVACYLVVHTKGTLMWDPGAVPDSDVKSETQRIRYRIALANTERYVTLEKSLKSQLAAVGYRPTAITFLAMSHYHWDHSANANEFSNATWLVRQVERDAMFAAKPPDLVKPTTFSALRNQKTVIIKSDDHDVFGDGSVVIKWAPGHTPGHQMLFVRLAKTGPVLLSGDLYHYPEEKTLDRLPTFDANPEQNRTSRRAVDAFLKTSGAHHWIQHDFIANAALKKAPAFYD